jgi:hypothetical protein
MELLLELCGASLPGNWGKKEGYEIVRGADEKGVSPGDELRILFQKFSPCLILIDEPYARQLYNKSDLPGAHRWTQRCLWRTSLSS